MTMCGEYEEWEERYFGGSYDRFCQEYGPEEPEEEPDGDEE